MKSLAKFDLISLGLWTSMWLVSYVVWPHVPGEIPTHWNLRGEVDGTSSRSFGLVFVPLLATMIVGLLTLLVQAIWIKESETIERSFRRLRRGMLALFAVLHLALVMAALGGAFDIGRVIMTAVGIFLAYVALLLPKVPRNPWFGLRTRASLSSDEAWKKSNTTASWALACAGIITVLGAFLPPVAQLATLVTSVILAATISVVSSFRHWSPGRSDDGVSDHNGVPTS